LGRCPEPCFFLSKKEAKKISRNCVSQMLEWVKEGVLRKKEGGEVCAVFGKSLWR